MRRIVLLTVACLVLASPAQAVPDAGTESPFALGAGARDLALGGASWASGDIATAAYWNASRLARAEHLSLGGFHARLFDSDVLYNYLGAAIPTLDYGTFGLGIFRLGVNGIERRDASNLLLDEFSDRRLGFHLAYAIAAGKYDLGVAAAFEHHTLADYSATSSPGVTLSATRVFEPAAHWLQTAAFAVNLRNVLQPGAKLADESVKDRSALEVATSIRLIPSRNLPHALTL